ncbi:MAG: hypothetical protein ACO1N0_18995 [Fluviicola sp.]
MNPYQKLKFFTLIFLGGINPAFSSERPPIFRPTISFIGSYTHTRNFSHLNDGIFRTENKKGNFGFELTNKFYVVDEYFVKTGIRYHQYKKTVYAVNQIPDIYDYPDPFSWEQKYVSLNVPILLGRDFTTRNGKSGDFYFGLTPGILMNTYKKVNGDITEHRDPNSEDPVYSMTWDQEAKLPNFFFVTADIGVNFSPIKKIPGFNVGLLCSFQLNKGQRSEYNAVVGMPSKGYDFFYNLHNENRVTNFSILFSYSFGKKIKSV